MIEAEQLHARILARLDMTRDMEDEELTELIYEVLQEVSQEEYLPLDQKTMLGKELFNAFRKLDLLQEFLEDDDITEIMINGTQNIFIEKAGRISQSDKRFLSADKLEDVIQQIVAGSNRLVNEASPIVDARLADGSRVNVVLPPVALNGPIVTIRKFAKEVITMNKLMEWQSINSEVSGFLASLVAVGYNIFISGGTGSGKTTFLNALSQYIPKNERIITIEDNAELQIQNIKNLVRLEARNANVEGTGEVTIRDLIKSALRMRPDRIIVGEVRSAEAIDMLQALNTGHDGSLSTGHANSPKDMISRLETMVLMGMDLPLPAIERQIASGLDIIVHLGRLRDKSRKVLEVTEVLGYWDGQIHLQTIYRYEEIRKEDENVTENEKRIRKIKSMENGKKLRNFFTVKNLWQQDITFKERTKAGMKTAGMIGITAWLYYRRVWAAIFLILPGIWLYREFLEEESKKKEQEFQKQFREMIQTLSSALNTGYSVENAFYETQKELKIQYPEEARISRELLLITRKLRMHIPVEQVLEEFAERVPSEDVKSFVTVFVTAKKSGGDMIGIIRNTTSQIGDKIEVKREIDTLLAAKKYEFQIMSMVPYGIIAYMSLSFSDFMEELYGNVTGIGVMTLCLGIYVGAYYLGVRLLRIDV